MNESRSLAQWFIFYTIGPIGRGVIGVISLILLSWIISPQEFGKYSLFLSTTIIIPAVTLAGFNMAYAREFYSHNNDGNLLLHCLTPQTVMAIVASAIVFIFRFELSSYLLGSYEPTAITLLLVCILITAPFSLAMQTLEFEGKALLTSVILILWRLLEFSITVMLIFFWQKSFRALIIAQVSSYLAITFLVIYLTRGYWISQFLPSLSLFKKITRFSLPLAGSSSLILATGYLNIFLLQNWSSTNEVGIYEIASKLAFIFILLGSSFERFWLPTQYKFLQHEEKSQRYTKVITTLSSSLLLLFLVLAISRKLITPILGTRYTQSTDVFIYILASNAFLIIASVISYGIHFAKKTGRLLPVAIIAALVDFFVIKILVPTYGAKGSSIALALSSATYLLGMLILVRRTWKPTNLRTPIIDMTCILVLCLCTFYGYHLELIATGSIVLIKRPFLRKVKDYVILNLN